MDGRKIPCSSPETVGRGSGREGYALKTTSMKLSEIRQHLAAAQEVNFVLPNGTPVPAHFHVTEVGITTRHFIDCGGTVRNEKLATFQLWTSTDDDHRLRPQKLLNIIALSERVLGMEDLDIEVEYQGETIGRYGLEYDQVNFLLTPKYTDCLAKENCGVPVKQKRSLVSLGQEPKNSCAPGGKCC